MSTSKPNQKGAKKKSVYVQWSKAPYWPVLQEDNHHTPENILGRFAS